MCGKAIKIDVTDEEHERLWRKKEAMGYTWYGALLHGLEDADERKLIAECQQCGHTGIDVRSTERKVKDGEETVLVPLCKDCRSGERKSAEGGDD